MTCYCYRKEVPVIFDLTMQVLEHRKWGFVSNHITIWAHILQQSASSLYIWPKRSLHIPC